MYHTPISSDFTRVYWYKEQFFKLKKISNIVKKKFQKWQVNTRLHALSLPHKVEWPIQHMCLLWFKHDPVLAFSCFLNSVTQLQKQFTHVRVIHRHIKEPGRSMTEEVFTWRIDMQEFCASRFVKFWISYFSILL